MSNRVRSILRATLVSSLILFQVFSYVYGQIISQFVWNSNPVTAAQVGPNATSVSGSAVSNANGCGGTNGLNAGLPKLDLELVITGSPTFDVDGIDVSIDFQRDENDGNFFNRGNSLIFGMSGGNLFANFRVENGVGGFTSVNSGNVYAIPNDDTYRTYRFRYDPNTGVANIMVNAATVYTYTTVAGRKMYWTGSGNVILGHLMDGNGSNKTFFDNFSVSAIAFSTLPIELIKFEAILQDNSIVELNWATASEINNEFFTIEKSKDGVNFEKVLIVDGSENSTSMINYSAVDINAYKGISYYRLKQTDLDGTYNYSYIVSVENMSYGFAVLKVFPNPSSGECTVNLDNIADPSNAKITIKMIDANGKELKYNTSSLNENGSLKINDLEPGIYIVNAITDNENFTQKLVVK